MTASLSHPTTEEAPLLRVNNYQPVDLGNHPTFHPATVEASLIFKDCSGFAASTVAIPVTTQLRTAQVLVTASRGDADE